MPNPERPRRAAIIDELGRKKSLAAGADQFRELPGQPADPHAPLLFLGLGPDPGQAEKLASSLGPGREIYFLEAPEFKQAMGPAWADSIPASWTELALPFSRQSLALIPKARIFPYPQGQRLFPSFWGPVIGLCRLLKANPAAMAEEKCVLLPGRENGLLIRELESALIQSGRKVLRLSPETLGRDLPAILAQTRPEFMLSVNFQGLDRYGETYHLLDQAGTKVAVWCVDNPWHLLSSLDSPYWKTLPLFVTDESFIGPLKKHGALSVHHLPLAASPEIFKPLGRMSAPELEDRIVFVGRSGFPAKKNFFAGQKLDPADKESLPARLAQGERPDFDCWVDHYGLDRLWPGKQVRRAGFAAEESNLSWRTACLNAAARSVNLTVFGDQGWRDELSPPPDLRPPVDYYGPLADIYAQAGLTLGLTSLLLPHGLSQRHFDVWIAGGFLLSDNTPGLSLFPQELTRPIAFNTPAELPNLAKRIASDTALAQDLGAAWKNLILAEHTYAARVRTILERL